jgi:uncharacterized membrane protein HdeD (DUF308 family)
MKNKVKHYSITLLINGLIALLFGALAVLLPQATIKTIAVYFGIVLLIGGASGLWVSIYNMQHDKDYLSSLVSSIVSIVVGVIVVFNTRLSLEIFGIVIGIWALVIGAVQLFIALKLLETGRYKKLLIINSIITLIFGLLLFISPFGTILILTRAIGVMALIFGAILFFFAISIRSSER